MCFWLPISVALELPGDHGTEKRPRTLVCHASLYIHIYIYIYMFVARDR